MFGLLGALLQVHLANLFGEDKLSFEDRVAFVDNHLDQVRKHATIILL